ncbi:MAG: PP2C family protein-serine/threonine phosphatase [Lachnospiraceae bacterium]
MRKKKISMTGCAATNVGYKRKNNEDNFLLGETYNRKSENNMQTDVYRLVQGDWDCVAVFDGMGGIDKGEIASLYAAEEFWKIKKKLRKNLSFEEIDSLARQGFRNANQRIVEKKETEIIGGTTATVLFTNGNVCKVYHMGDSRAYLFRKKKLMQLTKDQTLAAFKLDAGFYEAEDPRMESDKHRLMEYIGRNPYTAQIQPQESSWMELEAGDEIFVCSDGFYDMCSEEEIVELLSDKKEGNRSVEFVKKALDNGGVDNITCILLEKNN